MIVKMDRIVTQQEKQMEFTILNKPFFDKMHVSGISPSPLLLGLSFCFVTLTVF